MEEEIYIKKYHCNNCNMDFYSKNLNQCISCYSNDIREEVAGDNNIKVIPFSIGVDDAIKKYKKKVMFNPLIPLVFKNKNTINNIKRVYIPVYLTDVNQNGIIEFIAGDKNGKVVSDKKYDVIYTVNFDYRDYLVNVSNSINDDIFSSICEYNYNNIQDSKYSLLDDCFIASNLSLEEVTNKMKDVISKHSISVVKNNMNHTLKKLKNDSTIVNFNNTRVVYVPVYLLNINYKNKNYQYIMNGENGKEKINLVYGLLNTIIFSTLVAVLIFLISYLVAYFF